MEYSVPDKPYDVGFTGTQKGMTEAQLAMVEQALMIFRPGRFHHGVCIGADTQADAIAHRLGYKMYLHPPIVRTKLAKLDRDISSDIIYEPKPYMARNEDIAKAATILIAAPKEKKEQQRSGTWATVRRGRRFKTFAILLVHQDGTMEIEYAE